MYIMNLRNAERRIKKAVALLTLLLFLPDTFLVSRSENSSRQKVFLSKIEISGDVPSSLRESIHLKLKSAIMEKYGKNYSIVGQTDLEVLFRQAESFQKQGKEIQTFLTEISGAKDADEIIYGKLFKDEGQIKLLLNNLKKDSVTKEFYTKSIVDISFFDSDSDFYIKEAAEKIMNPRHKILHTGPSSPDHKKVYHPKSEYDFPPENKIFQVGDLEWGEFEGIFKWREATVICESKGMRLPTPEELKNLAHLKNYLTREPCCVFWTSRTNAKDGDYAFYIDINDGFGNYYHKDIDLRVRCVK